MAELCLLVTTSVLPGEVTRRVTVALALLLPLMLLSRAPEETPRIRFLPEARRAWLLLLFLPLFLLLISGISIGWGELAKLLGVAIQKAEPMADLPSAILLDALLPAVCEEVFCRGAVYSVLRPLGRRVAVPASALIFALMHMSVAQLPHALVAGLLLALLYEIGGLAFPIIFHFTSNFTSLLLLFGASPLYVFASLGVLAAVSLPLLCLLWRRLGRPRLVRESAVIGAWRSLLASPLALWGVLVLTLTFL